METIYKVHQLENKELHGHQIGYVYRVYRVYRVYIGLHEDTKY